MRNTRRALNRTILLVIGLVLLAVGAALVLVVALPGAAGTWTTGAEQVRSWAAGVGQPTFGWSVVAALAVVVIVMLVLAGAAVRGRHRVPLQSTRAEGAQGRITVTDGFASEALKNALADRDEILSSRVSANEVRGESVLHVAVTPRQNTSPREVVEHVDTLVSNLATLTGQQFRTFVSVHSCLRAKLAHDQRRVIGS